jgi:hypothetical protein
MLRPIKKIDCAAALSATQKMIQRFALWLCDSGRSAAQVTEAEIKIFDENTRGSRMAVEFSKR